MSNDRDDPNEEDVGGTPPGEKTQDTAQSVRDQFNGGINPTFNVPYHSEGQSSSQAAKQSHDETPSSSSSNSVGPFLFVDQRAKVFRSHDKVLWCMFISDVGQGGSGSTPSKDSNVKGSIFDEDFTISIGDQYGKNMKEAVRPTGFDDVLLLTKTLDEYLQIHQGNPKDATIGKKVFWASYFDSNRNKFIPITGVYYFDFWFDFDTHVLDLLFWSNVYSNSLNDEENDPDKLYDGLKGPQNSDIFDTSRPNGPIQRAVFYTKGTYKVVTISNTQGDNNPGVMKMGMSEERGATIVGMYLFSKPVLIMNPGQSNSDTAFGDPVTDRIPFSQNKFVELK